MIINKEPETIDKYLDKILKQYKININSPESQLIIQWSSLAGEHLSKDSQCLCVKNGIVFVKCVDGTNASLIKLNSKEIIKKINAAFPELNVTKIYTKINTVLTKN